MKSPSEHTPFEAKFPQTQKIINAAMAGDDQAMKDAFAAENFGIITHVMVDLVFYCVKEIEAIKRAMNHHP